VIALLSASVVALLYSLLLSPSFIRLFRRLGWGQMIRVDGPTSHQVKRGTPTKGGIIFLSATTVGYIVGHLVSRSTPVTVSGVLALFLMLGLGLVGFLDDFTKTRRQQSLGLTGWQKIGGQVLVATLFAVLALEFRDPVSQLSPASTAISFVRDISWLNLAGLGTAGGILAYLLWLNLLTVSTSNAVNVTDGLDGLAVGATILALSAYMFIGLFQSRQSCQSLPRNDALLHRCFAVRDPLDLAIIAAALAASLVGYLWWSGPPAQIFMGDTGSLGLGGALSALAIFTHTELLLIVIGGLYCIETGSVILQRAYFKITHGRRIIRMSPIHHHFELLGWPEVNITVRFWIIAGLCMATGVGIFYLSWIAS
jgi:phospho-N-acetylmuramoyl-pentapeptide-transferase